MNITPIINLDNKFSEITRDIESNYKGDWNDSVHDSYRGFVNSTNNSAEAIHYIRCQTELVVSDVESLCVNDIEKDANSLCREVDTI